MRLAHGGAAPHRLGFNRDRRRDMTEAVERLVLEHLRDQVTEDSGAIGLGLSPRESRVAGLSADNAITHQRLGRIGGRPFSIERRLDP